MGIRLKRFPEYGLDFSIYSGLVTAKEVLSHFRRLDAAANWLSYLEADTDMSAIDLAHFPALKRGLLAKEAERSSDELRYCLLVNVSPANEGFARFWCAYAEEGIEHAHRRAMCGTLETAFDRLDLPPAAREAVARALEESRGEGGRAPAAPAAPSFAH